MDWHKTLRDLPSISMLHICSWTENEKTSTKGYKFFVESYLSDILVSSSGTEFFCKAKCHASQRKNVVHDVALTLNRASGKVSASRCSCKAG